MTGAPDSATGFVGSIPEFYDGHLGPLLFAPYARDLASRVPGVDGQRVLELACGTGILTRELLRTLPARAELISTDLNEPMLAVAQARLGAAQRSRVAWRQADAMALPFEDAAFDVVVAQFGVMFFPDKAAAAAEVRRVLRTDGVYVFNVWGTLDENPLGRIAQDVVAQCLPENTPGFYHVPWGYSDPARIEADLRAGGFRDVAIEVVELPGRSESARHASIGVVQGSPMATAIRDRGTVTIEEVTDRVAEALTREFGAGPITIPMRALVVVAS